MARLWRLLVPFTGFWLFWRGGSVASLGAGNTASTRSGTTIEIGVKGRANANVSIATSGSFVGLVWAARTTKGVTDIYATTSGDSGRSFRAPVRVNQMAGEAT